MLELEKQAQFLMNFLAVVSLIWLVFAYSSRTTAPSIGPVTFEPQTAITFFCVIAGATLAYLGSTCNALIYNLQCSGIRDGGIWLFFHPGKDAMYLGSIWLFLIPVIQVTAWFKIMPIYRDLPIDLIVFMILTSLSIMCFRRACRARTIYFSLPLADKQN